MAKKKVHAKGCGRLQPAAPGGIVLAPPLQRLLPVVAYAIFTLLLFREFIFSKGMLYGADTFQAGVFFRNFFVQFVKTFHELPQWDPYLFCGMPYLDAFHGDILYPLSLPFKFLLPLSRALGWILVFHIFLAGCFMYLCARGFGLGKFASFFAGTVFMLSSYLVSLVHPGHDGKIFITALFLLALFFLHRGLEKKRAAFFVYFGVVVGVIIITPHPQMAYFSLWGLGAYTVFRLVIHLRTEKKILETARLGVFTALAVLLALAISAIQFWPGYVYVKQYSPRAEGAKDFAWATSWSLHPEELVSQVVPEFSGQHLGTGKNDYWGRNPFKDNSEYAGLIPLLLAGIALVGARRKEAWFFCGLGLFVLIYALGATTPFFHFFYAVIPNIRNMRAPSMIMFLFAFCSSLLGAMGLEEVFRRIKQGKLGESQKVVHYLWGATALLGLGAIIVTFSGQGFAGLWKSIFWTTMPPERLVQLRLNLPRITLGFWLATFFVGICAFAIQRGLKGVWKPTLVGAIIWTVAFFDLWRMDGRFIYVVDPQRVFGLHPSVEFLKQDPEPFRCFMQNDNFSRDYFPYYGIELVSGYHGNQLRWYQEFLEAAQSETLGGFRFWNLINTKYFILPHGVDIPRDPALGLDKVYDEQNVTIYRNLNAQPRAFVVHQIEVIPDREKILPRLADPTFDYRRKIILEEDSKVALPPADTLATAEPVRISDNRINSFTVTATLDRPGFLFLSDTYYPAWKVLEGNRERTIYRADYAFRAVYLEAGTHVLRFVYDSALYRIAKQVTIFSTLFAFAFLGGDLAWRRWKKKRGKIAIPPVSSDTGG